MTSPAGDASAPSRPRRTSLLTLVVLVAVLAVGARSEPEVTTARTGRRVELVELIRAEQARTAQLEARVADLAAEVAAHEQRTAEGVQRVKGVQRRISRLSAPAGMTGVRGPGLTATLTDSSLETSPSGDLNDLVIHEQDLQAVINSLWSGGAEAMSVNGQRVLATTAIRCVGNTLLLHGGVYSPPYVVRAVGDPVALSDALDRDPVVERFRAAVTAFDLGFAVMPGDELALPAYEGPTTVQVAAPTRTGLQEARR